jgi:KipI family sensor histidine kinase inhibitor
MDARFLPAGECALTVEFGATAEPAHLDRVLALDAALAAGPIDGVLETVPTYRSLMVHFDPAVLGAADLAARLQALDLADTPRRTPRHWTIPACWDPPYDEDLAEVAELLGLPPAEVAARHAEARYTVVMYGFAPGFVFLAGLPDELNVPRRKSPRPPAPPGALTIANGQALIASIAMPTGWYMLGRTPARTFDPARDPTFPLGVGDTVTFERVDAARFEALEREVAEGRDVLGAV